MGLDWQKVGSPLLLRNWEPGDKFRPLGDAKGLKLKELFRQRKGSRLHEKTVAAFSR